MPADHLSINKTNSDNKTQDGDDMKKSILGILIGSTIASALPAVANASASGFVSSNITAMQLWAFGNTDLLTAEAPGYFNNFQFGGIATDVDDDGFVDSANLTLTGEVRFRAAGLDTRLTFDLNNGNYVPGSGITFTGGDVLMEMYSLSSGWVPYSTIDAATTNLGFLANQPGHFVDHYPGQVTAGIVRNALPGLWDGVPGSAGFNRAATSFILFGTSVGLYLEGSIVPQVLDGPDMSFGPAEVPVPAAAWLFGSGLAGLAAVQRRRRAV